MAVITLPQQNLNVPSRGSPRGVDRGGEMAEASARAGLANTVGKSLVALTGLGIDLWKEHEARTAQKDFDAGKLSYIKAMDEQAALLAQSPMVPTTDDPYPNATSLEKRHKEELQRISGLKNSRVKDSLSLYAQQEFQGRYQKEKMKDIESGRKATFDNYIEDFQYFMSTGDLEKCTDTISKMVGFGLVDKKAADDLLDGAYQYKQTEALMAKAVTLSEEDGAKLINAAVSYKGHDGKDLAYSQEQKDAMVKSFTDRWKAIDGQKKQEKIDNYLQASNEYLKSYTKISTSPVQLMKFKEAILDDARSADFEGHTGLREKYVKMIDAQIENLGKEPPEKDNPAVYSELMKMWGDESIRTQDIQLMAQKAFAERGITEKSKNLFMGKRTELEGFAQGSGRIKDYFDLLSKDKKLDPTRVNELYSTALGEYNDLFSDPKWMTYTKEKRVELLRKHTDGIINSYSRQNVADYLEGKKPIERMENFVASPYANKNNDNKDLQRQIQNGALADTKVTANALTQHQNGLKDMAFRTIGTAPAMTYEQGELATLGQNQGDVIMAYKAKLPDKTSRSYPFAEKLAFTDKNGQAYNLYKWTVDDNNVWKLNLYNKGDAKWEVVDEELFKRFPLIEGQAYWKNPPPPKITPSEAVSTKNEDIWTKRQQWNQEEPR